MVSGRYMTSPILLVNLAGEMIYILNQRLKTQSLTPEKALKIINDIAYAIFNQSFIDELFQNNKTLSYDFLKSLFMKLVHASIMKLSSNSFSKLFDLMVMAVKLQIFLSSSPLEIYSITANHLYGIKNILEGGTAQKSLQYTIQKFNKKYAELSVLKYLQIKQQILNKFKYDNVRISMFLQNLYQDRQKGFLYLYRRYAPHLQSPIGAAIFENYKQQLYLGERQIQLNQFKNKDFKEWQSELGLNLYEGIMPLKGFSSNKPFSSQRKDQKDVNSLNNSLSKLIIGDKQEYEIDFTLQMFSSHQTHKPSFQKTGQKQVIRTAPTQKSHNLKENILKEMDVGDSNADEDDDFLEMMDDAMK